MTEPTHDIVERLNREDMQTALLSVSEAAIYAGVSPDRIRQWKRRGHLKPASTDVFGRPEFWGIDVMRAWAKAERNAARTQADNLAPRHASGES